MSFSNDTNVRLVEGNVLKSDCHALVNTVNCVGVMGKGIALAFKRAYPAMFEDYAKRCAEKEVRLGSPYAYDVGDGHIVVNFPTKGHWRAVSRLADIEGGLDALKDLVKAWNIRSIAVPPLGCGNGQLDWSVVGPTLARHLNDLGIPVELFVPQGMSVHDAQLELFDRDVERPYSSRGKVEPGALALVEILRKVGEQPYGWPVGRIKLQKIAYFATVAGIPTGLDFHAASYGPYAEELKRTLGRLQNNGLVDEVRRGKMFVAKVGETYETLNGTRNEAASQWANEIARVSDLMSRLDTTQSEIAATVHYAAARLWESTGGRPSAGEVIEAVERWKLRRKPPLMHAEIGRAVVNLATQGWINVEADETIEPFIDELVSF